MSVYAPNIFPAVSLTIQIIFPLLSHKSWNLSFVNPWNDPISNVLSYLGVSKSDKNIF